MIGNATVSVLSPSRASGSCISLICTQYLPEYGHGFEESRSHPGSPRNFKILSQVQYHGIAETLTRVPGHKQACCYKQSLPCLPRKPLEPEFFFLVIRTQSPHRLRCTRDASRVFTV